MSGGVYIHYWRCIYIYNVGCEAASGLVKARQVHSSCFVCKLGAARHSTCACTSSDHGIERAQGPLKRSGPKTSSSHRLAWARTMRLIKPQGAAQWSECCFNAPGAPPIPNFQSCQRAIHACCATPTCVREVSDLADRLLVMERQEAMDEAAHMEEGAAGGCGLWTRKLTASNSTVQGVTQMPVLLASPSLTCG